MAAAVIIKAVILLSLIAFSSARQFPDFLDVLTRLRLLNNSLSNLENVWSASYDQHWLQSIYSNNTLYQSLFSNVSYECKLDMSIWASSLMRKETWAVQSQWKYCILTDARFVVQSGHCKRYKATGPHRATGLESTWSWIHPQVALWDVPPNPATLCDRSVQGRKSWHSCPVLWTLVNSRFSSYSWINCRKRYINI